MKDKKKKITVKTMVFDNEDLKKMGNKLVINIGELMKEAGIEKDTEEKDTGKKMSITIELD